MKITEFIKARNRLDKFVYQFGHFLGRKDRHKWCGIYLSGLILEGERKSIEPLAGRVRDGNVQNIQQFVSQSPWAHEPLQQALFDFMNTRVAKSSKGVLILDDTSLPKKGEKSVGVGRQYCGSLGKVSNCQAIVTWHFATKDFHFPLLGELYLPKDWTENASRLSAAGVPEGKAFRKKWEIALELLDQLKNKINYRVIVMDAGYGEIRDFLRTLDQQGEMFIAQVPESHCFWPHDVKVNSKSPKVGRPRKFNEVKDKTLHPLSCRAWKTEVEKIDDEKIITLKRKKKNIKVCVRAIRVRDVFSQAYYRPGKELWLIIEKRPNGDTKYYLSNLPETESIKNMIHWANERWKVEQGYQFLKEELGLDHYEGRSWRGLHHHITLCFMAFDFILSLKNVYPKKFYQNFSTNSKMVI